MEQKIFFLILFLSSRHLPDALHLGLFVEKGYRYINLIDSKKSRPCSAKTRTRIVIFKSQYCHKKTYKNFPQNRIHLIFSVSKNKKPPKFKGGFHFFYIPINSWGRIYFIK